MTSRETCAFVHLRRVQGHYAELRHRLEELASRVQGRDELLSQILAAIDALHEPEPASRRPLGFRSDR